MYIEDHRRYFIKEEYWDRWGVVESEDAYICHDVLDDYAKEWNMSIEELLEQLIEI